jgi:hypothetical protein
MPAEDSVSETKERMNVRELFEQSTLTPRFRLTGQHTLQVVASARH